MEKLPKPQLTAEEAPKEARQAERLNLCRSALGALEAAFGASFARKAPELMRGEISAAALAALTEARAEKSAEKIPEEELSRPVAARLKELNEKLEEAKMPVQKKAAFRKEMAAILKEYRQAGKDLEEAKTEKITPLLDLYINSSDRMMAVVRKAANAVLIAAALPWLRASGYLPPAAAAGAAERGVEARAAEIKRAQAVNKRLEEIYQFKWGPFRGSQIEEWQTVRNSKAADLVRGEFGPPAREDWNLAEENNRKQMQEYLKELREKTKLPIKPEETVEEYVRRASKVRLLELGSARAELWSPAIETEDGVKAYFQYNAAGEVAGVYLSGEVNVPESQEFLKDDWPKIVKSRAARGAVQSRVGELWRMRQILNALEASAAEEKFLSGQIQKLTKKLESEYGEILKK